MSGDSISLVAGWGQAGFSGDGGRALCAELNRPGGIAVDGAGGIYLADTGNSRIRRLNSDGFIQTIAGTGTVGFFGDGGPALAAQLRKPADVAVDRAGNVYIADTGNHRIRKITIVTGVVVTLAGPEAGPEPRSRATAQPRSPSGVAVDHAGTVYFSDTGNNRIRRIGSGNSLTTVGVQ